MKRAPAVEDGAELMVQGMDAHLIDAHQHVLDGCEVMPVAAGVQVVFQD